MHNIVKEKFRRVAGRISIISGSSWAFILAISIVATWALTGPIFDFSNTWQLVINTGTTIVTFLMVFLIQNTQNRDGRAVQIKLDELIRATRARDSFIDIEDLSDDELAKLSKRFSRLKETEAHDPALEKLHKRIDAMLNTRVSIPGEDMVGRFNPFVEHTDKKSKK